MLPEFAARWPQPDPGRIDDLDGRWREWKIAVLGLRPRSLRRVGDQPVPAAPTFAVILRNNRWCSCTRLGDADGEAVSGGCERGAVRIVAGDVAVFVVGLAGVPSPAC